MQAQPVSSSQVAAPAGYARWGWNLGGYAAALMLLPYTLLLAVFFFVPIAFILLLSFQSYVIGKPLDPSLRLDNYVRLLTDSFYLGTIANTLKLGLAVTVAAIVLGFPVAYSLARGRSRYTWVLRRMLVAPLLVSVIIRTYGWLVLLSNTGLVNQLLLGLGIVHEPIKFLFDVKGIVIGLVEVGLPLMVLTMIGVIENIKVDLEEAALSLGANRFRTFLEVILPLSLPGILAGSMLVFAAAVASFVTPALLGGPSLMLLSTMIYQQIMVTLDWSFGATLAAMMMLISVVIFFVSTKLVGASRASRIG
jgi:putative spermidine/putrescine transport system permease protein